MTNNKIRLPFGIDPAPPYQMLYFHYRQGIKKRLQEKQNEPEIRNEIISAFCENIRALLQLPDGFSIIIVPSEYYLIPFFNRIDNKILAFESGHRGIFNRITGEKINVKKQNIASSELDTDADIFISDTDICTGFLINDDLILEKFGDKLKSGKIHIDVSASLIGRSLDFSLYSSIFFNTRYMFGLYPGLLVWLVKKDQLKENYADNIDSFTFDSPGHDIYCHRDLSLVDIYVMSRVVKDMAQRGLQILRNEIIFKSILIYQAIEKSQSFDLLLDDEKKRSANIICMRPLIHEKQSVDFFAKGKIQVNYYHSNTFGLIVQLGNFPVHSKEQAGYLADLLEQN